MSEEPSLLDDLREMRDDLQEPGAAGLVLLALVALGSLWLAVCVGAAYL